VLLAGCADATPVSAWQCEVDAAPLLSAGELTPLGFTASQAAGRVTTFSGTLAYAGGDVTDVTVSPSYDVATARYVDRTLPADTGVIQPDLGCVDAIEAEGTLGFVTADGLFDTTWPVTFVATTPVYVVARGVVAAAPTGVDGTLAVDALWSDSGTAGELTLDDVRFAAW
jgi:hypothetical protein